MKRLIILLTVGLLLLPSAAAFGLDEKENMCNKIADTAALVMRARQSGVPMAVLLKKVREADAVDAVKNSVVKIVIEAYRVSRFETKSYQERATQRYRENFFIGCMNSSAGDN